MIFMDELREAVRDSCFYGKPLVIDDMLGLLQLIDEHVNTQDNFTSHRTEETYQTQKGNKA